LSLFVATLALAPGCDSCPAQSCGPPLILRLDLPATVQLGNEVVACHLDTCATAHLLASGTPDSYADLSFSTGDSVTGWVKKRADGSLQLMVSWVVPPAQGDRYTLTVSDAAGAELASLDVTATLPSASMSSGGCPMCVTLYLGDPA
jgi:hypothetical protein